jgi:hypothetical protein
MPTPASSAPPAPLCGACPTARETRDQQFRRQAMAALQDSHDPRALAFFESVLTK